MGGCPRELRTSPAVAEATSMLFVAEFWMEALGALYVCRVLLRVRLQRLSLLLAVFCIGFQGCRHGPAEERHAGGFSSVGRARIHPSVVPCSEDPLWRCPIPDLPEPAGEVLG